MCGVVLGQVRRVDLVGDTAGDGLDEEGDRGVADVCLGVLVRLVLAIMLSRKRHIH